MHGVCVPMCVTWGYSRVRTCTRTSHSHTHIQIIYCLFLIFFVFFLLFLLLFEPAANPNQAERQICQTNKRQ